MLDTVKRYMPFLSWLPQYDRKNLRGDVLAGLTTAVMLIPQAMAYAMLAGLPPIHGLYASIVPLAIYALFGTSRDLAVGPVAMVSLLVATGVGALADTGSEMFIAYAILLALMVGVLQLVMGVAKLGFLVNFLSHPVISGFTSAAALIIGFSQLKHLLGVDIERSKHVHEILMQAFAHLGDIQPITLAIGAAAVLLLLGLKKWKPNFPRALAVVALGTGAVYFLGLHEAGVAIVGSVPAGLPSPAMPTIDFEAMKQLMPIALTISLVGFMESISVAKAFANRKKYEVDANQELVGLGLANIGGAFFRGYPVTGGFSRTAVNAAAGSKTGVASLITAGVVALALIFLTPLFYYMPKAILAAIIMVAVFGLVDVAEVKHLWKVKRSDLALLAITFAATLTLGIEEGIATGVGASLLWFVVRTTRPHFAVLGRLPGTDAYRNVKNYSEAETLEGVLMVRMDAQFYFGNVSFLKEKLSKLEENVEGRLKAVVIDASSMNQLDSSADQALHELAVAYRDRGVKLLIANVKQPVWEVLEKSHFVENHGKDHFFLTMHEAAVYAESLDPATVEENGERARRLQDDVPDPSSSFGGDLAPA
jgi:SulP family sulfate permease